MSRDAELTDKLTRRLEALPRFEVDEPPYYTILHLLLMLKEDQALWQEVKDHIEHSR